MHSLPSDANGLNSVDRALQILQLLDERRAVRVMDVADHLGVARSTAHRLLTALHRRAFVVQDAARIYHRGPAWAGADRGVEQAATLRSVVHPHLRKLSSLVDETCQFAVLQGNGARFLDVVAPDGLSGARSSIGILLPAHTTAAGRALLAELSVPDFFALYPRGVPGRRGETVLRSTLQRDLALSRRRGFSTSVDIGGQVTAVGVALRNPDRLAVAAIAVTCTGTSRSRLDSLVTLLRDTAANAEDALHRLAATSTPDFASDFASDSAAAAAL